MNRSGDQWICGRRCRRRRSRLARALTAWFWPLWVYGISVADAVYGTEQQWSRPPPVSRSTVGPLIGKTGADSCEFVTATPVPVGPTGTPLSVTINGDNANASGPDCAAQAPDPLWWEAFSLDKCGRVMISFCGTAPAQLPSYAILFDECPCGERIRADDSGRFDDTCADGNTWMVFDALPAGTYYLPIYSDEGVLINERGPYTITISASGCLGVCCNPQDGTCDEGIAEEVCSGPFDVWSPIGNCCEAECLPPGQEFAAGNVQWLSRVALDAFSAVAHDEHVANDVWGYVSPSGREYAILGLSQGTGFVDITDPFDPVVLTTVPHAFSIWADMAVFDEFAYSVNETGGGMQIIDLREIDDGVVSLLGSMASSGVGTAHNVYVNRESGYAYLCGANVGSGGLLAVDLAEPANPVLVGAWTRQRVHDTFVISYTDGPNAGREIAFNFCGQAGLRVVDVTDKDDMHQIGTGLYPNLSFAHQGWIDGSRNYLFLGDELDELQAPGVSTSTTYVFDVSTLIFPTVVTSYTNGVCAIDHNLMVRGGTIYAANYTSGLRVYDAVDPLAIQEVGFFDTHPEGNEFSFDGAWGVFADFPSGVVLVSDVQRGLFVLNFDCNGNGVVDAQDIASKLSVDCNVNGLPDECEYLKPGDLDLNRVLNADDEAVLTTCLGGPTSGNGVGSSNYVAPCCIHSDGDADGDVDLKDLQILWSTFVR